MYIPIERSYIRNLYEKSDLKELCQVNDVLRPWNKFHFNKVPNAFFSLQSSGSSLGDMVLQGREKCVQSLLWISGNTTCSSEMLTFLRKSQVSDVPKILLAELMNNVDASVAFSIPESAEPLTGPVRKIDVNNHSKMSSGILTAQ